MNTGKRFGTLDFDLQTTVTGIICFGKIRGKVLYRFASPMT